MDYSISTKEERTKPLKLSELPGTYKFVYGKNRKGESCSTGHEKEKLWIHGGN